MTIDVTGPPWHLHRWPTALWTWHCHLCDTAGVARTADAAHNAASTHHDLWHTQGGAA